MSDFKYEINDGKATITDYTGPGGAVTVPDTIDGLPVAIIGDWAFEGCGLTSITLGNSVTTIGDSAFKYCTGLTSITLPKSLTTIESSAFSGCHATITIRPGGSREKEDE